MSRDINIDLTKGLEANDPDDLRYAADRNLLSPADEVRVRNFLDGIGEEEAPEEVVDNDPEEMADLLAILEGSVGEVNDRVDKREDLTRHEVDVLLEAERAGKDRKGVIEHLESIEFEDEESENEEDED